jgi:4-amino-4-deoxy-L-arabinose transferase-like glycosyltransferase
LNADMPAARISRKTLLLVLLLAAALPYFVNLGVSSIWDANEAFYAQTPREMMAAHDYVNPSFNFQLRYNKPVFSYWEVAAAYHLFGVSEWSERLPIAIGGIVLIATAFGLGQLAGGAEAGLVAALVLAASPRVLLLARRIIIDVHIAMFTGLVLLCFALAEARPEKRRLYLVLMYVAAGFGVLTKGPVAVFLPALVFFTYLASLKRLGDLRRMMLPVGAAIGLVIVVPWCYLVYRQYGFGYIRQFIVGENLGRYAQAVGEQSRGPLFYVPVMLADLFPWSLLIPAALWWGVRERANNVVRLLLVWVAAIVVFFSFSGTKEDLYVLPIVTAEAALIGAMIAAAIPRARLASASVARPALLATAGVLVIAGAAMVWVFGVSHRYALQGATFIGVAAVVGGLMAAVAAGRGRMFGATAVVGGAVAVISWCIVLCSLPDFERYKPVRPFAAIIRARASEEGIVGSYKFALPSMVFYLNRPIMEVELPDHLRVTFRSSSDVYFVMPEDEYLDVKDRLPVPTYVLARQPMFDLRPKNFLEGSELPQFVLISNRPGSVPAR